MNAAVYLGKEKLPVQNVADPTLAEGEMLLAIDSCSVCGTDLRIYKSGHFKIPQGTKRVLSHETAGEVVEVREWVGRGEDWRTAVDGVPESALRLERDPVTAEPRAVWVRWEGREHLLESGPDDRHYALERTRGRLQFGDDRCGRIPPASASVALSFTTGIGEAGNVPAGTITELRTGVAYLQGVSNPVAADGGAAPEAIEDVVGRATFRLRHRGRAVASDDYAWMANEA